MKITRLNALPDGGDHGPVIYIYRVGADCYVGKAKRGIDRCIREYANNVRKLRTGQPYRPGE